MKDPCASVCIERPAGAGGSNSCSAVYDQCYIDAPAVVYRDTDSTVDETLYVTQDANFNVTAILDAATGAAVNRFVYTPYGQRTVLTATWTAGTTDFSLGHQGLMLDEETGLYYNRGRQGYHPTLGRFVQRDPEIYTDGGNLYQYVQGDPLSWVDSSGHDRYVVRNGPHHGIMVDTWEVRNGQWVHTGRRRFDFSVYWPDSNWGWLLFPVDAAGAVTFSGRGRVREEPDSGCNIVNQLCSTPEMDEVLLGNMESMLVNPPNYHVFFYNCNWWVWNHIYDGMPSDPPEDPQGPFEIGGGI